MVKTVTESSTSSDANRYGITKPGERNSDSCKYKGVRKRKWGKWVSEIRLPNSRERIWLGSYDSPVKAARAFDAALFCLRGPTAKFNFPDNPPDIPGGRSLAPSQIQAAAAQFANSGHSDHSSWSSSGSDELQQSDSPCPSGSDGATHINNEMTLDNSILDEFACMDSGNNNNNNNNNNNVVPDFGNFPDFDDFPNEYFIPPQLPGTLDYGLEDQAPDDEFTSQVSFLWNF